MKCEQCSLSYELSPAESDFLKRLAPMFDGKHEPIPAPRLCPLCRCQRRMSFRNERSIYHRTCDLTGKKIISVHRPDVGFPVYDAKVWWSDQWDPMSYGKDFDFSRPFFDQYNELRLAVPRRSVIINQSENCDYSPYCTNSRNCYYSRSCVYSEDCHYCYQTNSSRDCLDCSFCTECELCYECLHCIRMYGSVGCNECEGCTECFYCEDCQSCKSCIGCKNLVGKSFYVFNKQVSEDEYKALREKLKTFSGLREFREKARALSMKLPHRASHMVQCENSTGDHLQQCRNCEFCFEAKGIEDCRYIYVMPKGGKDCQDIHYSPLSELCYDGLSILSDYRVMWSIYCWNVRECMYCEDCDGAEYLFGCIGLRKKKYCVFNKQHSKEEYEALVPRIIKHMRSGDEWGRFFPASLSPFGYNETIAEDHFPLSKVDALEKGFNWSDFESPPVEAEKSVEGSMLPETIDAVPDDVLQWAIVSEDSKRPFKVISQELGFYRKMHLPLPHMHPETRYRERMKRGTPMRLWKRACGTCGKDVRTSYDPERPEKIFCEECYLKEVY